MNYPVWDVPFIGSGWTIGIIAIIHVLISHFAVGAGLLLPVVEAKAVREGRTDWFPRLEKFSKFFLVLTGVFGAVTGVGIWFSIGLANPEGTSALIHNFVFGWAIEWVFFIVELSLAAAYYYTWNRIPQKTHLRLGWAYSIASWGTLVIINGILTFKLTPGAWLAFAGGGNESHHFWDAFMNPGYFPSLGLRTLACVSLAGIWGLVFFGGLPESDKTKPNLVSWSTRWVIPAYVLMPFFFAWYLATVPADHRELLTLGIGSAGAGTFSHVTRMALVSLVASATTAAAAFFFTWSSPGQFTRKQGLALLFLALVATGSTESVREFLRKPFVVNGYLYSNGVRVSGVATMNEKGYLASSPWTGNVEGADLPPGADVTGQRMFQGQCLSCHTLDGYRPLRHLLAGRDGKSIGNVLQMLHDHKADSPYRKFMPPLVGTPDEIAALRRYLDIQVNGKITWVPPPPKADSTKADSTRLVAVDTAKAKIDSAAKKDTAKVALK